MRGGQGRIQMPGGPPPGQVPMVIAQCVEPTQGPWNADPGFGRRVGVGSIDQSTGVQAIVEEGQEIDIANADHLPGPPRTRAINLFRSDGVQPAAFNANFRLRCTYGAGGITNSYDADWIHGGQFNVVADNVRMSAVIYRPRPAAPFLFPEAEIILGYTIGEGATNPSNPLTFTTEQADLVFGGSVAVAVPDFARKVRPFIFDTVIAYTDYQILLEDGSGPAFDATFSEAMFLEGLSLPGWVERVRVVNVSGAALSRCAFQFELGL